MQAAGDLAAAADLFAQAVERAPRFACGLVRARRGAERARRSRRARSRRSRQARAHDPDDRLGAGAAACAARRAPIPPARCRAAYVRALFDQYAPRFDRGACRTSTIAAPQLLLDAVDGAAGPRHFGTLLDLGCGTGLAGAAFRAACRLRCMGVDLSPKMIEQARAHRASMARSPSTTCWRFCDGSTTRAPIW